MSGRSSSSPLDLGRLSIVIVVPAMIIGAIELTPTISPPVGASPAVATAPGADGRFPAGDEAPTDATATTTTPSTLTASSEPITVAATGEILPHPSIVEHARRFGETGELRYDFGAVFADLRPTLEAADVAICHLEVPVAPDDGQLSGYPSFGIPADIGPGIADGGWDRCSTASNHSNDKGTAGIVATLDALDGAEVGFSGMARTPDEAASAPFAIVDGAVVAHFSYTWGFNASPPAEPWMVDVIDPERILADGARARSAGADLVVVSLHWGDEYDTAGSDDQRRLATRLLSSPDIDLIIGHGPHVIQPVFEVDGEYALLSTGNLVANQGTDKPSTYDGMIATLTFERGADGQLRAAPPVILPTWYDGAAGVVRSVDDSLDDPGLADLHDSLQASRDRIAAIVGPYLAVR